MGLVRGPRGDSGTLEFRSPVVCVRVILAPVQGWVWEKGGFQRVCVSLTNMIRGRVSLELRDSL